MYFLQPGELDIATIFFVLVIKGNNSAWYVWKVSHPYVWINEKITFTKKQNVNDSINQLAYPYKMSRTCKD